MTSITLDGFELVEALELILPSSISNPTVEKSKKSNQFLLKQAILRIVRNDNVDVMQTVLSLCSIQQITDSKALVYAVKNKHFKSLKALANAKLDPNDARIAIKVAVASQQWEAFLTLAQHVNPHSALTEERYINQVTQRAPISVFQSILSWDPNRKWSQKVFEKMTLWVANPRLDVIRLMIPHVNPKSKKSEALFMALKNRNDALAQLLLPHSEPKDAIKTFVKDKNFDCLDRLALLLPESTQQQLVLEHGGEIPRTQNMVAHRDLTHDRMTRAGGLLTSPIRTRLRP